MRPWDPLVSVGVVLAAAVGKSSAGLPPGPPLWRLIGDHRDRGASSSSYDRFDAGSTFVHQNHRRGVLDIRIRGKFSDGSRRFAPTVDHRASRRRLALQRWLSKIDDESVGGDEDATKGCDERRSLRSRSKEEWIDGRQMTQILARKKAEERRRKDSDSEELNRMLLPKRPSGGVDEQSQQKKSPNSEVDASDFVSRTSYTDANTLRIEIPATGVDGNAVAAGAFAALWFSAVAPATISVIGAGTGPGALFMAPFWLAGGAVARTAVYDPFVSSTLSVGRYLWTLEKGYLRRMGLKTKKEEGSTESLRGASVEIAMVVNDIPRHQIRLFLEGEKSIAFGKGLALEELQGLCRVINDHCAALGEYEQPDAAVEE